jgi:hypothetical protein
MKKLLLIGLLLSGLLLWGCTKDDTTSEAKNEVQENTKNWIIEENNPMHSDSWIIEDTPLSTITNNWNNNPWEKLIIENLTWSVITDGDKRTNKINWWISLNDACTTNSTQYIELNYIWNESANATSYLSFNNTLYFVADLDWYVDSLSGWNQTWYLFSYDCTQKVASQISDKNIRELFKWSAIWIRKVTPNYIIIEHKAYEGKSYGNNIAIYDRSNNTLSILDFAIMSWYSEMIQSLYNKNWIKEWLDWNLTSELTEVNTDMVGSVTFSLTKWYNCLSQQEIYSVDLIKNLILSKTKDVIDIDCN